MQHLSFFFDFLSPYSFLAWKRFYAAYKKGVYENKKISLYPVTLANIIHSHETKGPAEIEPKREYLMRDCLRYALANEIEFNPPILPFNSLYALRISLEQCCGEHQWEVINLFYCAAWERGYDLGSDEVIKELLEKEGYPARQWIEAVGDRVIRAELKKNTKMAINAGVFGLPTIIVRERIEDDFGDGSELFWGNDSMDHLNRYIKGEDPFSMNSTHPLSEVYKEKLRLFQSRYQSL